MNSFVIMAITVGVTLVVLVLVRMVLVGLGPQPRTIDQEEWQETEDEVLQMYSPPFSRTWPMLQREAIAGLDEDRKL